MRKMMINLIIYQRRFSHTVDCVTGVERTRRQHLHARRDSDGDPLPHTESQASPDRSPLSHPQHYLPGKVPPIPRSETGDAGQASHRHERQPLPLRRRCLLEILRQGVPLADHRGGSSLQGGLPEVGHHSRPHPRAQRARSSPLNLEY